MNNIQIKESTTTTPDFKLIFRPELQQFELKFNKNLSYPYKKLIKNLHTEGAKIALEALDGKYLELHDKNIVTQISETFLYGFICDSTNDIEDYEILVNIIKNYVHANS